MGNLSDEVELKVKRCKKTALNGKDK